MFQKNENGGEQRVYVVPFWATTEFASSEGILKYRNVRVRIARRVSSWLGSPNEVARPEFEGITSNGRVQLAANANATRTIPVQ